MKTQTIEVLAPRNREERRMLKHLQSKGAHIIEPAKETIMNTATETITIEETAIVQDHEQVATEETYNTTDKRSTASVMDETVFVAHCRVLAHDAYSLGEITLGGTLIDMALAPGEWNPAARTDLIRVYENRIKGLRNAQTMVNNAPTVGPSPQQPKDALRVTSRVVKGTGKVAGAPIVGAAWFAGFATKGVLAAGRGIGKAGKFVGNGVVKVTAPVSEAFQEGLGK